MNPVTNQGLMARDSTEVGKDEGILDIPVVKQRFNIICPLERTLTTRFLSKLIRIHLKRNKELLRQLPSTRCSFTITVLYVVGDCKTVIDLDPRLPIALSIIF